MANNFFGGYSQPQQSFMQYQQPQQNNILVVPVQGEAGARIYPVAAGNTVLLIDFDSKKFWLKSTDTSGLPSRFAAFTFTEEVIQPEGTGNFISRNEFNELKQNIDKQFQTLIDIVRGETNNVATAFEKPSNVKTATSDVRKKL